MICSRPGKLRNDVFERRWISSLVEVVPSSEVSQTAKAAPRMARLAPRDTQADQLRNIHQLCHMTYLWEIISSSKPALDHPAGLTTPVGPRYTKMPSLFSPLALRTLRTLVQRPTISAAAIKPTSSAPRFQPILRTPSAAQAFAFASAKPPAIRQFSTSPFRQATFNQVRRGCRTSQAARRSRSPALIDRSQMKGVCMKTGITKPKKPNSGERKTARVRLTSGKVVTAYIPGEGMSISCLSPLAGWEQLARAVVLGWYVCTNESA